MRMLAVCLISIFGILPGLITSADIRECAPLSPESPDFEIFQSIKKKHVELSHACSNGAWFIIKEPVVLNGLQFTNGCRLELPSGPGFKSRLETADCGKDPAIYGPFRLQHIEFYPDGSVCVASSAEGNKFQGIPIPKNSSLEFDEVKVSKNRSIERRLTGITLQEPTRLGEKVYSPGEYRVKSDLSLEKVPYQPDDSEKCDSEVAN